MRILSRTLSLILFTFTACSSHYGSITKETYTHKYGDSLSKQEWMARGKEGTVTTVFTNGSTKTAHYTHGLLDGEETTTFPHSKIPSKTSLYHQGVLASRTLYHTDGLPKQKEDFEGDSFTITTWYPSGSPKTIETFLKENLTAGKYFSLSNQLDSEIESGTGIKTKRDDQGKLLSKENWEKGQLTLVEGFFEDGTLKEQIPYVEGKVQGVCKTFFPNGKPRTIEEWEKGALQGISTHFSENGSRKEISFSQNKKEGIEKFYNPEGILVQETSWKNDRKHGPIKTYGKSETTRWFLNGHAVSRAVFEDSKRH